MFEPSSVVQLPSVFNMLWEVTIALRSLCVWRSVSAQVEDVELGL